MDAIRAEASPERLVIDQENADYIRKSVYHLKEPYHKVAVLFFLEERSVEEISQTLERPKKLYKHNYTEPSWPYRNN